MDDRNIKLMTEILEQLDTMPTVPKEIVSHQIREYSEFLVKVSNFNIELYECQVRIEEVPVRCDKGAICYKV
jgi:hypothetical protein